MLNPLEHAAVPAPTRRVPSSLRQEYQEFILERIEEYKNTLGRRELLQIGDEAVRELEASARGQYLLTEVLLLEHVDRIIARRLKLPSFRRWAQKHRALRAAQREPTHWGLAPDGPLVAWTRRLEPGDGVVVIGAAALPAALFVAAHEADVLLVDQDLGTIEAAEQLAITEQLGARFEALVIQFGRWFPDVLPSLVILDPAALAQTTKAARRRLIRDLQALTRPRGVHVVLAAARGPDERQVLSLAVEGLLGEYKSWMVERRRRAGSAAGFTAVKPERQGDTAERVSE